MTSLIADHVSIDPRAEIAEDVEIGPFCVIGPHVRIGRGTRLTNNVTICGHVTIGQRNHIFPNAVIGAEPQDLSYQGTPTRVILGDDNIIREGVTIHRATEKEDGVTEIGNHNFFMANSHIAHDCKIGNHVVIANGTMLGGHVHVNDHASISGAVGIHHFTSIGQFSFISGLSLVRHDVPPFMLVDGCPARPRCINVVALKRNRFSPEELHTLAEAHRLLYRAKVGLNNARDILRSKNQINHVVGQLLGFVESQQQGKHGRARERRNAA